MSGCPTTRRHPRTLAEAFPADYADPIEHHPSPRAWLWNDALIAALLVGVLVWLLLLSGCGGGGAIDEERTASIGPPDCRAHPDLCQ